MASSSHGHFSVAKFIRYTVFYNIKAHYSHKKESHGVVSVIEIKTADIEELCEIARETCETAESDR